MRRIVRHALVVWAIAAGFVAVTGAVALAAPVFTGPARWSDYGPVDGSSVGVVRPPISATVTDAKGLAGSPYYSLKVDGKLQTASLVRADANTITLNVTPKSDLANGTHTVYMAVKNGSGVYSTVTWTFTVSNAPKPSAPLPGPGSTATTDGPIISVAVGGATTGLISTVVIDGATIPSAFDAATGLVTAPTSRLANDASHDVTVTVVNASGQSSTLSWSFAVQIYEPMAVPAADCVSCHPGFPDAHPMDDCNACHGPGSPVGEGWNTPDYAVHPASYVAATASSCVDCHSSGYAGVPAMHGFTPVATYHDSSTTSCAPCHVKSLTTEHNRHGASCLTCHASADPLVAVAIATGRTDCEACHPGAAAHTSVHETTVATSCGGTGCHAGTALTNVHSSATTCDICHKSADPRVVAAIAGGVKTCDACHASADHEAQHAMTLDADCAGSGCHAATSLTSLHINSGTSLSCASCHASADARVIGAIAAKDKSCSACHAAQPHPGLEAKHAATMTNGLVQVFDSHEGIGAVNWDVQCSMCHASTQLLSIHGNDCAACHNGSQPAASFATWNKSCQQGACHPTIAHAKADPSHDALVGGNCETCHEPNWDVYLATCESCHDPAGATPPTTSSDVKSSYIGSARITFDAPGVHYTFYRLDGAAKFPGNSITVPGPATGSATHTIEYWSVNDAGAQEVSHKTATFTITADTVAPTTTSNAAASYIGPATITLAATDDNSRPVQATYWKLDGGAQTEGRTVPVPQPATGSQTRTLEFWSVDAAGNEELPHKTKSFTVTADTAAPTTTSDAPAYDKQTGPTYVHFTVTDPAPSSGTTTYYRLNGAAAYKAPSYGITLAGYGAYSLEYWSVDNSGNEESPHKTATLIKDPYAPNTNSDVKASYSGPAAIRFTATDSGVAGVATTYYQIDSDPVSGGTSVTVSVSGSHTVKYWSVDRAGNTEAPKSAAFTVTGGTADITPPTTTSDVKTSYASAAVIKLTASDGGGSGVASTRYRVDGGGETSGTTINVPAPANGSVSHTIEYWSVDVAGNVEMPKSATFTITYSTATIRLIWGDNDTSGYIPIGDSWAAWTVRSGGASGPIVASGSSSAGSGWDGIDDVVVPVSDTPYYVNIDWWDADWGTEGPTVHWPVSVTTGGSVVILRY